MYKGRSTNSVFGGVGAGVGAGGGALPFTFGGLLVLGGFGGG